MDAATSATKNPDQKPAKLTPADAVNHRQDLRPLPLRVAKKQYERLDAARTRTGISIQEHARRALDLYLGVIEREAIELGLMPERGPVAVNTAQQQPVAAAGRAKPLRDRPRIGKR